MIESSRLVVIQINTHTAATASIMDRRGSQQTAQGNRKTRSKKGKKGDADEDDAATCDTCAKVFKDENDKLLRCTWCETGWRCIKCLGYTEAQYDFLSKDTNMLFCCKTCEDPVVNQAPVAQKMISFMDDLSNKMAQILLSLDTKVDKDDFRQLKTQVDSMEDTMKQNSDSVKQLENKLDQCSKNTSDQIDQKIDQKMREKKQDELRQFNIIMYNIAEATGTSQERQQEDEKKVRDAFKRIMPEKNMEIKNVVRLGKFQRGKGDAAEGGEPAQQQDERPRPVKIILYSMHDRDSLVKKLAEKRRSSSDDYKDIQMTTDRSKEEREQYKILKTELEQRKKDGEDGLYIRDGKIVKRDPQNNQ